MNLAPAFRIHMFLSEVLPERANPVSLAALVLGLIFTQDSSGIHTC